MRYLRQNTATVITVGPFLDKTDGITPEVAITVTGIHMTLMVDNGGTPTLALDADATASGGNNDMVHITNDDAGYYSLELTAANTNYVGGALLSLNIVGTACPVFHEFEILPANVYDQLHAAAGATGALDGCISYGTAAAIANGTITLASGHGVPTVGSALCVLTDGTDAKGKSRIITYSGSGDVFNVDPAWNTAGEALPSGTITYRIYPAPPAPTSTLPRTDLRQILGNALAGDGSTTPFHT